MNTLLTSAQTKPKSFESRRNFFLFFFSLFCFWPGEDASHVYVGVWAFRWNSFHKPVRKKEDKKAEVFFFFFILFLDFAFLMVIFKWRYGSEGVNVRVWPPLHACMYTHGGPPFIASSEWPFIPPWKVQRRFTSAEAIRPIRDGEPWTSTWTFTQLLTFAPGNLFLSFFSCCFTSTEATYGLLGTGGRGSGEGVVWGEGAGACQ